MDESKPGHSPWASTTRDGGTSHSAALQEGPGSSVWAPERGCRPQCRHVSVLEEGFERRESEIILAVDRLTLRGWLTSFTCSPNKPRRCGCVCSTRGEHEVQRGEATARGHTALSGERDASGSCPSPPGPTSPAEHNRCTFGELGGAREKSLRGSRIRAHVLGPFQGRGSGFSGWGFSWA